LLPERGKKKLNGALLSYQVNSEHHYPGKPLIFFFPLMSPKERELAYGHFVA